MNPEEKSATAAEEVEPKPGAQSAAPLVWAGTDGTAGGVWGDAAGSFGFIWPGESEEK
ncbi:MAG TPA: hypothetical protein VK841_23320 [Polyangiaceae bacterium]|jgi:hypothetical protein|nr:hypothetical protein [Polyangiaceae bacterium]